MIYKVIKMFYLKMYIKQLKTLLRETVRKMKMFYVQMEHFTQRTLCRYDIVYRFPYKSWRLIKKYKRQTVPAWLARFPKMLPLKGGFLYVASATERIMKAATAKATTTALDIMVRVGGG